MMVQSKKSLIVVTWDGQSQPLQYIYPDTAANYELLIFDYSGKGYLSAFNPVNVNHFVSYATECKGQIITHLHDYIASKKLENAFYYIGIFDDDQFISVSGINQLLFIGQLEGLDVFQPSLTHDSHYDNRQFIHKPGYTILPTDWVEVMCPFYRMELFIAFAPHCKNNISGTGLDLYLVPTIQYLLGMNKTVVVHAVQVKHCRPVRTGARTFSNNKNSLQEIQEMKVISRQLLKEQVLKEQGKKNHDQAAYQNLLRILEQKRNGDIRFLDKVKRIPLLIKNTYQAIVDASYR